MVLQAQLALQDREASWVFRVKEESAGCRDFLDLRCVLFYFFIYFFFKQPSLLQRVIDLHEKTLRGQLLPALRIRAHQENRERRDRLERKDRRDLSASPVPTGLAVIRVLT